MKKEHNLSRTAWYNGYGSIPLQIIMHIVMISVPPLIFLF